MKHEYNLLEAHLPVGPSQDSEVGYQGLPSEYKMDSVLAVKVAEYVHKWKNSNATKPRRWYAIEESEVLEC
jgi:hypothetical protein